MTSELPPLTTAAPSGAQHELVRGDARAVVVEVGGGVRELVVDGRSLLHGYGPGEIAPGGAGQVLAPWPNRVAGGRYSFAGHERRLALTEPAAGNAIHGLVRWGSWSPVEATSESVSLTHRLNAQPTWPWSMQLRVTWTLTDDGLRADHEVVNLAAEPAPFALGVHPYLHVQGARADELTLTVPAGTWDQSDAAGIPVSTAPVAGGEVDFSAGRRIDEQRLDHAFGDLARDDDGLARSTVRDADGWGVELWQDRAFGHVQAFTGDTLAEGRRRRAVALEPMTAPANALASGRDLVVLPPGGTWRGSWGLRLLRP